MMMSDAFLITCVCVGRGRPEGCHNLLNHRLHFLIALTNLICSIYYHYHRYFALLEVSFALLALLNIPTAVSGNLCSTANFAQDNEF